MLREQERHQWVNAKLTTATTGLWAEAEALRLLQGRGWILLEKRWSCRYGEIDLLLCKANAPVPRLLAVEVKGRRRCGPDGWGLAAFDARKRQRLALTLNYWIALNPRHACSQLEVVLALVPLPPNHRHRPVRWLKVPDLVEPNR
ncbi:MAG: YraN family protein [Synechococcus sp.]|uniref:YraN family protein n=1 Tax=Synechococcus sp. BMK-MC-1 TaxID=1442551 RepID=UPI0016494504|nr:YraN family protein [Synechococcus sp. BMK-MC-1]